MNPINNLNNTYKSEKPLNEFTYSIEGGVLYIENLEAHWNTIATLPSDQSWEKLYLSPGETLSREMAEEAFRITPRLDLKSIGQLVAQRVSPLFFAAALGSLPLIEKYFSKDDLYQEDLSPLAFAYKYRHYEAFEWLLNNGVQFIAPADPFRAAYRNETFRPFAALLVKSGYLQAQVQNWYDCAPALHEAAAEGELGYFKFLVSLGAPLDLKDQLSYTPLYYAIKNRHLELVAYLLSLNVRIDSSSANEAIKVANLLVIESLLERGCPLTWNQLVFGSSTLQKLYFKYAGNLPAEEVFIQLECPFKETRSILAKLCSEQAFNINMRDAQGTPLLYHLIRLKDPIVLQAALMHPQLNKEAFDAYGVTPLQLAAGQGNLQLVELLLDAGFEVNGVVPLGMTPLHIAAERGDEKMVSLLVERGANLAARSVKNSSPFTMGLSSPNSTPGLLVKLQLPDSLYNYGPAAICKFHTHGRLPFAAPLYEEVGEQWKLAFKEQNLRRLAAHVFELQGNSPLISKNTGKVEEMINLEGTWSDRWLHGQIIHQLNSLENDSTFPHTLCKQLIETFEFSAQSFSHDTAAILQRFQEGKPVIIFSGYHKHAVQIVFYKKGDETALMGIHNRNQPLELYYVNPRILTEEMVTSIRSVRRPRSSYQTLVDRLRRGGKTTPYTELIKESCPLGNQIVGNCAFASLEAALYTLIAINNPRPIHEAVELFKCLQVDLKLRIANEYFAAHLGEKNPYLPDMTLISALFKRLAPYEFILSASYQKLSVHQIVPWEEPKQGEESKSSELTTDLLIERYYN